jgi:prolyl-tRNA editing enzyme YbaK/EbsC (Cys-tRNA(Pro) deacylase)
MSPAPDPETRVFEFLERHGIPFRRLEIDPEFADTEAFCARYGIAPEISGNTIIVASRREPKRHAACVVTATMRLDVNHRVREILEAGKLSFATADETLALTGMLLGGVTPFDLPADVPILIDATIRDLPEIVLGSGGRSSKVRLAPADLGRLPAVRFVNGLGVPRGSIGGMS